MKHTDTTASGPAGRGDAPAPTRSAKSRQSAESGRSARGEAAGPAPRRLLVIGGSGFLGRRVVAQAVRAGHQVVGLARSAEAEAVLGGLGAQAVRGDLDDPASVERALRSAFPDGPADALVCVASLGFGHAGTIVQATEAAGIRRAVFVSTTGIFTTLDPPSKRIRVAAEETIRASGLEWTILRPTMIYGGPDDRNMCRLLTLLRRWPGRPVLPAPGGGNALQQPVHVDDLAAAVLGALGSDAAVRAAYNLAGPEPLTFRQVVAAAGQAVGRAPVCVPVPAGLARGLVGWYEARAARPRLKAEQITRLTENKAFDITAARRDLGFRPRPFAEGIQAEAALLAAADTDAAQSAPAPARALPGRAVWAALPKRAAPAGVLAADLRRIAEVAGPAAALRFAAAAVANAPSVLRSGNLSAADRAMAGRSWTFRPLDGVEVTLPGEVFGGAREMYCRRVYFALPGYAPRAGEVVVDLGANQGLFSVLAARAGADVIAVEAQRGFAPLLRRHAEANGVGHRIQVLHALVGAGCGVLADPEARLRASHWDGEVERMSLAEVFERGGADRVDLLKMDIEGSEFALFDEPGWLDAVDRIVMEVHPRFGSVRRLTEILARRGFTAVQLDNSLRPVPDLDPAASGYLYARRQGARPPVAPAPGGAGPAGQAAAGAGNAAVAGDAGDAGEAARAAGTPPRPGVPA